MQSYLINKKAKQDQIIKNNLLQHHITYKYSRMEAIHFMSDHDVYYTSTCLLRYDDIHINYLKKRRGCNMTKSIRFNRDEEKEIKTLMDKTGYDFTTLIKMVLKDVNVTSQKDLLDRRGIYVAVQKIQEKIQKISEKNHNTDIEEINEELGEICHILSL